jgi:hypothetical protein
MHNILSRSQLNEWHHFQHTVDNLDSDLNRINDYYECLIECEDTTPACKRVCKRVLMD